MFSACPGVLILTVIMVILLQLVEQTTGYEASPCNENNKLELIGSRRGSNIQSDGKSCKQLRNCKSFAKINNSDPHDAHKTWVQSRGQMGLNDLSYYKVWNLQHTVPHWQESSEDLFKKNCNCTELRITCWRTWKTESFVREILVNGK